MFYKWHQLRLCARFKVCLDGGAATRLRALAQAVAQGRGYGIGYVCGDAALPSQPGDSVLIALQLFCSEPHYAHLWTYAGV